MSFAARHNARQRPGAPVINFYPMRPGPNSSMAYVLARMDARIGHSPRSDQLTFAWDTGTWFSPGALRHLPENALNRRCLDIAKGHVDAAWVEVAGYSIALDPLKHTGPIVEKPEENGKHGGRVVEGPIAQRRPGMVYQRLVDGRPDEGSRILQLRVVIIGSRIVFVYLKWRPYPQWFKGTEETLPRPPDDVLSPQDQALLLRFANAMGIEYGELDTLRDRVSGLLYVVDANRTPVHPKALAAEHRDTAFGLQAEALAALIPR
jgi:hypothetical protein